MKREGIVRGMFLGKTVSIALLIHGQLFHRACTIISYKTQNCYKYAILLNKHQVSKINHVSSMQMYLSFNKSQVKVLMQERAEQQMAFRAISTQEPQLITIDEKWIANQCCLKIQFITCPVCYSIPLDYPKQCQKCERIFCHTDYEIISGNQNRCPNCKAEPWNIKKDIHIAYKHMFDSLVFKCALCLGVAKQRALMNKNELILHLENIHNKYLSDESILYDYMFINEKGQEIKLNLTQNIEINFKRNERLSKFEIAGVSGRVLNIDLKEMVANHHQLGKCKIAREISKTIKKNHQYMMWIVNISDPDQNDERIVFYSQQLQEVLQKNYQDFERNQRLNQFCMDVRETRYRISFSTKTQTNTYTRAEKRIMRLSVIFR